MKQKKEGVYYTKKEIRDKLSEMKDSSFELGPEDKVLESGSDVGSFLSKAEELISSASQSV
jgi:hypothetical protein